MTPLRIALLGAESTGKTTLAHALADHWRAQGRSVALIPEVQRAWCEREGRVPRADEYAAIAQEQQSLAEAASAGHWLVADTTPLVLAVYADLVFGDRSMHGAALAHQQGYDATLLMGLDLPWAADGLREGRHSQEPADAALRSVLREAGVAFSVVHGHGPQRLANALHAIGAIASRGSPAGAPRRSAAQTQWRWPCEKCSDAACEHRLFSELIAGRQGG